MLKIIFWSSVIAIVYTYFGYPALLYIVSLFKEKPIKKREFVPKVAILISVYNEEDNIAKKIENCLNFDYPEDRLEIIVGSDGSTDRTDEIIEGYAREGIRLYKFKRRGKPSVLNELVLKTDAEIALFTDATEMLDRRALRELVSNFADERIGCVSGELILTNDEKSSFGDVVGFYWRYEKFLRKKESQIGSMIGATGAIYAIRKELYTPLRADTILDDVVIPMKIVEKGYRAIFEPEAKAYDRAITVPQEECRRKVRTLAGNYQVFILLKDMLNPFRSSVALQFISHKLLRVLAPFFLITTLVSNFFLRENLGYTLLLTVQLAFYLSAAGGFLLQSLRIKRRIISIPYVFCMLNVMALVGLYQFVTNGQKVVWKKEI